MTLYADILFLVNFVMNTFVLWIVSKITKSNKKLWRLLLGSAAMSILYTLLIAIEALRFINVAVSSVVILTIGIMLAFRPRRLKAFGKTMAIAYTISFLVGGFGMSLFFLTDIPYAVYFLASDGGGFTQMLSWQLVLACTAGSYIIIKLSLKAYEKHSLKRQMLCTVQVFMDEKDASFNALVDTGHSLKDPLSQCPVIIAEFELVKEFLPDGLKVLFYEHQENNLQKILLQQTQAQEHTQVQDSTTQEHTSLFAFYRRIRMIPFTSLGRSNGMLVGFRPDKVALEGKISTQGDVVIGIYNNKLCNDGKYQGLLSPELIPGRV